MVAPVATTDWDHGRDRRAMLGDGVAFSPMVGLGES